MDKQLFLLGLLRHQNMHGYQLNEFIESTLATCVDIKKSTAYYALSKMLEDGWVMSVEEQEGNRPPRRVYSITPEGEAAFQRLVRENLGMYHPTQFGGDFGLAFLDVVPSGEARQLLEQRRVGLVAHLAELQAVPVHQGSLQLMIEHQLHHLQTELAWLDEVLARLEG
ncbi:MAG: PadR family transcriptional regulator [Anaerolineales bacterium]